MAIHFRTGSKASVISITVPPTKNSGSQTPKIVCGVSTITDDDDTIKGLSNQDQFTFSIFDE